jgi:peroxiredoxin
MTKKQPRKKRYLIWGAELLVFVLVYVGVRAWLQRDMVEGPAPMIEAVTVDDQAVSLEDYRGKPLLIHFWASWCGICGLEQGTISKLKDDWQVLTIAMQSGNATDIKKYMQEESLEWTVIADPKGEIARLYGVRGVPANFVLDADGNVRFHESGFTTGPGLRARLWAADSGAD